MAPRVINGDIWDNIQSLRKVSRVTKSAVITRVFKITNSLSPINTTPPCLKDEIIRGGGQVEPPGMNMIYLPYCDDIRDAEEVLPDSEVAAPRATDEQIRKASALIKRIDLKDFSVCQFANPALQRHYAILQALALEDDEMPDIKDETLPDEEGMSRPGILSALEEFKRSVYGHHYDEEGDGKASETSKKQKAIAEDAFVGVTFCLNYGSCCVGMVIHILRCYALY